MYIATSPISGLAFIYTYFRKHKEKRKVLTRLGVFNVKRTILVGNAVLTSLQHKLKEIQHN